jgi:cell division protein FtsL
MMEALHYAVKKDIRNTQIVREVDRARHRDLWRWARIGSLFVGLLLYSAWQDFELLRYGYRLEQLQKERREEGEVNRHLRLQIHSLKAPQRIAGLATRKLRMVEPGREEAIVIERAVPADPPPHSVVARDRQEARRAGPGS